MIPSEHKHQLPSTTEAQPSAPQWLLRRTPWRLQLLSDDQSYDLIWIDLLLSFLKLVVNKVYLSCTSMVEALW